MSTEQPEKLAFGASDRIELIATIVMAAAAILTAWAAFQSAKWSGIQAIEFSKASAARIESTRFDTAAGQLTAIDVSVYLSWLEAVSDERQRDIPVVDDDGFYQPDEGLLSKFYYDRMRAEFRPALDAWLATNPLNNPAARGKRGNPDKHRLHSPNSPMYCSKGRILSMRVHQRCRALGR